MVDKPMFDHFYHSLYFPCEKADRHLLPRSVTTAVGDRPLDHTNGRLYRCDGHIFYSPNCSRAVPVPPPVESNATLSMDPLTDDLKRVYEPRWWSEETAYLAFVCLQQKYVGLPFETLLNIPYKATRLDRRGYCAESWRKLGWHRLETILHLMIESMAIKYSLPPHRQIVGRTLSLKSFFRNSRQYRAAAQCAISWFSVITAQMSWSLAVASSLDNELELDKMQRPTWLNLLSKTAPGLYWDEITLASVRQTLGTFSDHTPRVGVYLNVLHPPKHQYSVDWLMKVHIPVYYPWGASEAIEATKNLAFKRLSPSVTLLQELHTIVLRHVNHHGVFTGQVATELIVSNNNERSLRSENLSWSSFSQKRQERKIAHNQYETAAQTRSRQQRERNPPTVNTKVFVWEEDEDGLYVRVPVRKYDNFDTLASFKASQKVYDSTFNEWDCSYDFKINEGVDADIEDDSTSEDDVVLEYEDEYECDERLTDFSYANMPIPGPEVSVTFALDQDDIDLAGADMLSLFREYYGFVPSLDHVAHERVELDPKFIMHLRNFVGLSKDEADTLIHTSTLLHLHNFATCVLKHKNTPSRPSEPVELWDLAFGNRQYLGTSFRLQCLRKVRGSDNKTYYLFDFGKLRTVEWNLAVPSIIIALFICRLSADWNEKAICSELLRRGTHFYTLLSSPKLRTLLPPSIYTNVLPEGYQFTQRDYQNYIYLRSDLLDNSRVCRAALMRGGIIWRLSLSHANSSEESALLGPTKYTTQQGISISFQDGSWQDDYISSEELDMICGTYECLTGKGAQTVTKSWWPPYSIWSQYYDYEYWTHAVECRFRARLLQLDVGNALPLSKREWKDWVRGGRITRDSKVGIENTSLQFLDAI